MKMILPLALALSIVAPLRAAADWTAVRSLRPGTQVVVVARGSQPVVRHAIGADDSRLTVLNLTSPALTRTAARALLTLADTHPDDLMHTPIVNVFVLGEVRVGPDGVAVWDRRVAELAQVIETIARADVAEIRVRRKGRGFWGHLGGFGGYFVGGMAGGMIGSVVGAAACRCDSLTGGFVGTMAGAVGGAIHGFRAARRETEDVIYLAP